jgi:hypothetical protein
MTAGETLPLLLQKCTVPRSTRVNRVKAAIAVAAAAAGDANDVAQLRVI